MVKKSTSKINQIAFKLDSTVLPYTWNSVLLSKGIQKKLRSIIRVYSLDSSIAISTIDVELRKLESRVKIDIFNTNNDTIINYKAVESYVLPVVWREKKIYYKFYTLSHCDYPTNSIPAYPTVSDSSKLLSFILKK